MRSKKIEVSDRFQKPSDLILKLAATAKRNQNETLFNHQINVVQLPQPEREYRFDLVRRWRFDFAWPVYRLAVEIEGAVFTHGRHTRGAGFTSDCEKYNAATALGWHVLRFPSALVRSGAAIETVRQFFAASKNSPSVSG